MRKKLVLHRETVAVLSRHSMKMVQGGWRTINYTIVQCWTEGCDGGGTEETSCLPETHNGFCATHLDCSGNQFCSSQGPNWCG